MSVEDYELGRRIWTSGKRIAILPYFVEIAVDLQSFARWDHRCYWDQNTWAARPFGFFATVVTRAVPFALLFAVIRLGDAVGLTVLATVLLLRLASIGTLLHWGLRDREGVSCLVLLPLRDLFDLVSWAQVYTRRTVIWRGQEFFLTRYGRLLPRDGKPMTPIEDYRAHRSA